MAHSYESYRIHACICHLSHGSFIRDHGLFMCDIFVCHSWLIDSSHGAFMCVHTIRVMAHSHEIMAHPFEICVCAEWLIRTSHGAFMCVFAIRVMAHSYEIKLIHVWHVRAIPGSFIRVMAHSCVCVLFESWLIHTRSWLIHMRRDSHLCVILLIYV